MANEAVHRVRKKVEREALKLLERHGRYHEQMGGFYGIRHGTMVLRAKDTHLLREKIEKHLLKKAGLSE